MGYDWKEERLGAMIRVFPQPEPEDFDQSVRIPGHQFLEGRQVSREGRVPNNFVWNEGWKVAFRQLYDAYDGVCAYLGLKFPPRNNLSIDHFFPRKSHPWKAYEWSNFRLADRHVNAVKGLREDLLDPFEVESGWFHLNLTEGSITPAKDLPKALSDQVQTTIDALRLDHFDFREQRKVRFEEWSEGKFTTEYLAKWAPFVYLEVVRQGLG